MIVASLLLVIAAAVTLIVGLLNREVISWVYASIACCLAAGLLLTVGVLRSRPSRKPVLQSGGEGQSASWAGASQWGSSGSDSGAAVLTRDDEDEDQPTVRVTGGDEPALSEPSAPQASEEPTRTDMPAESASPWAPDGGANDDTGEMPDVRLIPPPVPVDPAPQPAAADPDDDLEIVPKPSARNESTDDGWVADESSAPPPPPGAAAPASAGAAAGAEDDAARFEQVLSPIAGVGPGKRAALLAHFGTYRKLRAATPEKLSEVPGVSRTLAQRIYDTLHSR